MPGATAVAASAGIAALVAAGPATRRMITTATAKELALASCMNATLPGAGCCGQYDTQDDRYDDDDDMVSGLV